jgi:hypothetical protein
MKLHIKAPGAKRKMTDTAIAALKEELKTGKGFPSYGANSKQSSKYAKSASSHLDFAPRPEVSHNPPKPLFSQRLSVARTVCS